MANSLLVLLAASLLALASAATTKRNEVTHLPGFGAPPTRTWTGFVEVDEASGSHLFFYFVESQGNPESDPIFWWQNGGPGASALCGAFLENGPALLNSSSTLTFNPWAWNQKANVLYVEFAPGVGYSFCKNSSLPGGTSFCPAADRDAGACSPCYASDASVATQNTVFLNQFLTDPGLFPSYAGRPLFLLGESYFGTYGPTLALELLKSHSDTKVVNLQGLWVTDPCFDNKAQFGRLDLSVDFALEKGLISVSTHQLLNSDACVASRTPVGDRRRDTTSPDCRAAWRLYDIALAGIGDAVHPTAVPGLPMYIDPLDAYAFSGGPDIAAYLGSASVRSALGADMSPNRVYLPEIGNNGYDQYTLQYQACNDGARGTEPSMVDVYQSILDMVRSGAPSAQNLAHIIVLSGDIDPVVELRGTEAAFAKLGFPVLETEPRRPWFFHARAVDKDFLASKPLTWGPNLQAKDAGPQVGGFVQRVDTNASTDLRFVTVRNSGHMTPKYAPLKTWKIVDTVLLQGAPLAPPLPADWRTSTDEAFYAYDSAPNATSFGDFTSWVVDAMKQA